MQLRVISLINSGDMVIHSKTEVYYNPQPLDKPIERNFCITNSEVDESWRCSVLCDVTSIVYYYKINISIEC